MIRDKKQIADAFYAFHDGNIAFEKEEKQDLVLKIYCRYLAHMINPKYDSFWVRIHKCQDFTFLPWVKPIEQWTSIIRIAQTELEISTSKIVDNKIELMCHQHNRTFDFFGGEILFDCEGIEVFDQEWNEISFETLRKICKDYWDKYK